MHDVPKNLPRLRVLSCIAATLEVLVTAYVFGKAVAYGVRQIRGARLSDLQADAANAVSWVLLLLLLCVVLRLLDAIALRDAATRNPDSSK